jgi:hypothetical protein
MKQILIALTQQFIHTCLNHLRGDVSASLSFLR